MLRFFKKELIPIVWLFFLFSCKLEVEGSSPYSDELSKINLEFPFDLVQSKILHDDNNIYADEIAAIADPFGRQGWYFNNDHYNYDVTGSTKINWYIFNGQKYPDIPATDKKLQSFYLVIDIIKSGPLHLVFYTEPKGDGNDASSWYRSRKVYLDGSVFETHLGDKILLYFGEDPHIYSRDMYKGYTTVKLHELTGDPSVGPREEDELPFLVAISTNSVAPQNTIEFTVSNSGYVLNNTLYDYELVVE